MNSFSAFTFAISHWNGLLAGDPSLVIREHFNPFSERHLEDAAAFFTADPAIQHRPGSGPLSGPDGYLESARMTLATFRLSTFRSCTLGSAAIPFSKSTLPDAFAS